MNTGSHTHTQGRRTFCAKLLAAGAVSCIGCAKLFAMQQSSGTQQTTSAREKFSEDSKMSFKEVYDFAFRDRFIPIMLGISAELGRENAIAMFKKITGKRATEEALEWAKKMGRNDLESWIADERKPDHRLRHVRTWTIIEDTKQVFEEKVTECLLSTTFRAAGAADIGYACFCHGDSVATPAFNPKIHLIRTKTLMQGDAYCNHRYVSEEA